MTEDPRDEVNGLMDWLVDVLHPLVGPISISGEVRSDGSHVLRVELVVSPEDAAKWDTDR